MRGCRYSYYSFSISPCQDISSSHQGDECAPTSKRRTITVGTIGTTTCARRPVATATGIRSSNRNVQICVIVVRSSTDVHLFEASYNFSVTFGNNRIQTMTDYHLLTSLSLALDRDLETGEDIREMKRLLQILLKDETFRVHTWLSPLAHDASVMPIMLDEGAWLNVVRSAWKLDPVLAVHMSQRFASQSLQKEVRHLIVSKPEDVIECPVAAQIMLGDTLSSDLQFQLKVYHF